GGGTGTLTLGGGTFDVTTLNRSEEHTSELQSLTNLVCRLLLEKKKKKNAKDAMDAMAITVKGQRGYIIEVQGFSSGKVQVAIQISFFFNDTATTEIYTLSLHDALPICSAARRIAPGSDCRPNSRPTARSR